MAGQKPSLEQQSVSRFIAMRARLDSVSFSSHAGRTHLDVVFPAQAVKMMRVAVVAVLVAAASCARLPDSVQLTPATPELTLAAAQV